MIQTMAFRLTEGYYHLMLRAMKNKMDLFSHRIESRKHEMKKKKHEKKMAQRIAV